MKEWLEKLPQVFYDKALNIKVRESLNNWLEIDNVLLELKKITQLSEQSLLEYAKTKSEESYHSILDELHNIKYKLLKGDFNMKEITTYVLENEITKESAKNIATKSYCVEKEAFKHLDEIYNSIKVYAADGSTKMYYNFNCNMDNYKIQSNYKDYTNKTTLNIVINHLQKNGFEVRLRNLNSRENTEIIISWED